MGAWLWPWGGAVTKEIQTTTEVTINGFLTLHNHKMFYNVISRVGSSHWDGPPPTVHHVKG